MCHLFGRLNGCNLADKNLGALGNLNAGGLGNEVSWLTNDTGINRTVDDDGLANGVELLALKEVAAARGKLFLNLIVDAVKNGHGLLGSANHTVVKRL